MAGPIVVAIRSDLDTPVGTIAAGTRFLATPAGESWVLEMGLPRGGVGSCLFTVPANAAWWGKKILDAIDKADAAREDYKFARTILGYGHARAYQWLIDGYEVDDRTLLRWGFTKHELREAS